MRKQLYSASPLLALFLSAFVLISPATAFAAQAQVSLGSGAISPSVITINPGDTVVWTNQSATAQSVIGNNGLFQSGSIASGGQFAATFNTSGTYNYYDNASGSAIVGEVIVTGNTTGSAAPTSTTYNPNANYYASTNANVAGSTNPTVSSLTSQVQALIAQINAIEGTPGGSTGTVSGAPTHVSGGSCPQIGRVLSLGATGSDVSSLQQFLGVSPATGYFGSITQSAVEQWQAANNIISYGSPATTGYGTVGPRTAAAIRLACSNGSGQANNSNSNGSGVVSGFLQVSPVSGPAPLATTVTVTVNAAGSCSGGTYTINYGDGSQGEVIQVPAGNCAPQNQSFQHTYQYGGTYTVTLGAGSHSSTATVTVSGPSTSVTGPGNPNQASGSMNAFITTGPAPLATTFYVSCASGLAYDVVFGDGSDLGSTGVSQSSCNGGLQSVAHTYTKVGSYTASLVVFTRNSQGTISSQSVAQQGITVGSGSTPSTPTQTNSFPPPTLTPNVGNNPLAVQLQFTTLMCSGYTINWGDGNPAQVTAGQCAAGTPTGQTSSASQTHTYTASGNYTITLSRPTSTGAQQSNTVAVSITN